MDCSRPTSALSEPSASSTLNLILPNICRPIMLNSSRPIKEASFRSRARLDSCSGFRVGPNACIGIPNSRCNVVARAFIWNDAVPVGAASKQASRAASSPALSTSRSPAPCVRATCSAARLARRPRIAAMARTVRDFPAPGGPVKIKRSARYLAKSPCCCKSSRSSILCS